LCNIAAQYSTGKKAAKLLPTLGSGKATPGSGKVVPSNIAIQDAKKGTNGGKKRHKQRPQWVTVAADYDDDSNEKAGGSNLGCVMTVVHSGRHQAWLPTYHFERLLKEAYPNHAYPIKHKLKDYDMMKNFMTSGSLT
jgi:hypothetical protein